MHAISLETSRRMLKAPQLLEVFRMGTNPRKIDCFTSCKLLTQVRCGFTGEKKSLNLLLGARRIRTNGVDYLALT